MVFVLVSTPVSGASVNPASTSVGTWSYGVVKTFVVPTQTTTDGWQYSGNATFGYTVTVYENSTSPTTIEFTVYRTMGEAYSLQFCHPSCKSPLAWANQSARAWESTTTFTNFTTAGTVDENGVPVSAVAIQNSTTFVKGNVTESSNEFLPNIGQHGPHMKYLGASVVGHSSVALSPALGLFPNNLTAGSSWNSSSEYSATGSASTSYYYSVQTPIINFTTGPATKHFSLSANGSIALTGEYASGSSFQYGGTTYPAIVLTLSGPFSLREGVIFVPTTIDLFGGNSQAVPQNQTSVFGAQMAKLDLSPGHGGLFHLEASSWTFNTAAANSASTTTGGGTGMSPAVASANPVSSGTVQAQPESAAQSSQTQQCLTGGGGCPAGSNGGGPFLRGLFGLVVVAGVAAVVAVLIALAVVSTRRRTPPPVYPNAVLYPPGNGRRLPPSSGGVGTPATPPPPAEEDPLDHLW